MHIEVDTHVWHGGPFGDPLSGEAVRTAIPFSRDHLIGVLDAALKSHRQHADAPGLWGRLKAAFGRTPNISLKGQYIRAAFFFTGRPLPEPLKAFADYTVSASDCAVLLKELHARVGETARKAKSTV